MKPSDASLKNANAPGIERFELGPFATNCYIVTPAVSAPNTPAATSETDPCWVIDVSFEPDELISRLRVRHLQPQAVILTHAHVDHIAGLFAFRRAFPSVPIWVHRLEQDWLTNPMLNLSGVFDMPVTAPSAHRILSGNEQLQLGMDTWQVFHTPGHSPGGITLYNAAAKTAFVGDTLFAGSIGRTDFPGSDFSQLENSIRSVLYKLPDDVRVFPGHGPPTTIGSEKRSNPYVRV